jgi:hypothetical protein
MKLITLFYHFSFGSYDLKVSSEHKKKLPNKKKKFEEKKLEKDFLNYRTKKERRSRERVIDSSWVAETFFTPFFSFWNQFNGSLDNCKMLCNNILPYIQMSKLQIVYVCIV